MNYRSYLIRVWRADPSRPAGPTSRWRSQVEHIQSGQRWIFTSLEELLQFLELEINAALRSRHPPDDLD